MAPYRHTYPDISFTLEKEEAFPILKLDQVQFKQVMTNLLDNAVQALNGHEKSIRISLTYDSTLKIARLECADTGHGLTPEDKLRIFEPYFSTKEKGTGLGLAIVASIVADHNGFVRVRDNHPQGAVIVVELPG
jgi:two-component system nitrogen regulation sensor histidine kinase NtrY